MKRLTLIIALVSILASGCAQQQPPITTFILVRHAEKANDGSKDPSLSEEGDQRAIELANVLGTTSVDAIYSTPFRRTESTVAPLAAAKSVKVATYQAMKGEEMDKIFNMHRGGTVVLSGHSNTTPWVASYFTGKEYPDFDDADYDNLIVLSIVEKGNAKAVWLNYGRPTP